MPRNPPRPGPDQAREQLDQLYSDLATGKIEIGEAVRRMRHISGLTQPQFARHRGISVQALRQIETGKANPTVATLNNIASIFGLKTGFVPKTNTPRPPKRPQQTKRTKRTKPLFPEP